jgi:acetyl esterase/lipase
MTSSKARERSIRRRTLFGLAAATVAEAAAPAVAQSAPAAPAPSDAIHIPARDIPPPRSVSAEARAYLATRGPQAPTPDPPLSDTAAWKRVIAARNAQMIAVADQVLKMSGAAVETRTLGGVTVHVATAPGPAKPHLFIHGGAFTLFAGQPTMMLTKLQAIYFGGVVYGVDYRMPPDHPYPAALDDCLAVYREVLKLHPPEKLLVSGESAGGNLAGALMHRARDEGLPPPGALFLNTPATDLTNASDSLTTNEYVDVLLKHGSFVGGPAALYAGDADRTSPYLSPLFGDHSRGFPPTYLRTGTRDMLLSDTVRMHAALRAAGVQADLYVGEAMPHSGLGGRSPEDQQARKDTIRWLAKHWTA